MTVLSVLASILLPILFLSIFVIILRWAFRINDIVKRLEHVSMSNQRVLETLREIQLTIVNKNNTPDSQ